MAIILSQFDECHKVSETFPRLRKESSGSRSDVRQISTQIAAIRTSIIPQALDNLMPFLLIGGQMAKMLTGHSLLIEVKAL
ncbi:hypothetical protein GOB87_11660 [Acetobacter estunensis]|uniref:Uncharacterized protein n=1 Tax=Acetobacter estunensis TaxID=104097 RepID=A0A967EJA4_9PROT|nr:hypothetical protein [Acetobacter estunensis]NHO54594.1 hypothetical protein [Acetobacter estunensis]